MHLGYSEKVVELFKNPKNVGMIDNPDAKATEGSVVCGDMIEIYLKVEEGTHRITDIKFQSYGCAANIATTSVMTELVKGKTIEEAKKLTFKDVMDALGGLPRVKTHCAVLSIDGLRSVIRNYEEKHGLVKAIEVDESFVRSKLRHVMHPMIGRDIVSTGLLRDIRISEGKIEIELTLFKDDTFRDYIIKEINERLQSLPNIKEVKVLA